MKKSHEKLAIGVGLVALGAYLLHKRSMGMLQGLYPYSIEPDPNLRQKLPYQVITNAGARANPMNQVGSGIRAGASGVPIL